MSFEYHNKQGRFNIFGHQFTERMNGERGKNLYGQIKQIITDSNDQKQARCRIFVVPNEDSKKKAESNNCWYDTMVDASIPPRIFVSYDPISDYIIQSDTNDNLIKFVAKRFAEENIFIQYHVLNIYPRKYYSCLNFTGILCCNGNCINGVSVGYILDVRWNII